ncbi:MAG: two-component regulator propeller domain-containing protein [Opitutaceae bacterium]
MRPLRRFVFISTLLPWFAAGLVSAAPVPAPQSFRQEVALHHESATGLPAGAIDEVTTATDGSVRVRAGGTWYARSDARWQAASAPAAAPAHPPLPAGTRLAQLALSRTGEKVAATDRGLLRLGASGWENIIVSDGLGRRWAADNVAGAVFDSADQLWFATKAGVGVKTPAGWRFFVGKDGLPWNEFTALAAGPDGDVWFGTTRGAIRWDGTGFHYRQGPRWLPDDHVRGVAVDRDGTAWFATGSGLGGIARRGMTLAAKAEFYETEIERHIKRTPYGYIAEAPLRVPGDRASAGRHDSDNDGLWTAMYGAGECFAFGATRDPAAKQRARQAFEALRFLQTVTQGGPHSPPRGYVARTILPGDGADPNTGRLAQDREKQKDDALWKVYEPRWPRSADGTWYWKSDTSSDELDGHYFFYPLYHDLVAESESERAEVRAVVRDLTDHLIAHGFTLTDHDGRPTRWGMYRPEVLNRDPNWWAERGLNSLSLLAYLAVARHVTGDAKYDAVARELIDRHGFAQNLLYPKVQSGPGSGNHSDDEMAFMCFYSLLRYSRDEALLNVVRTAFYAYWQNEAPEMNPFFNYAYAAVCDGRVMLNQWGTFPLSPYGDWRGDSLATLRGFPLDRLNWPLRNAHRLDVVRLPLAQSRDFYEPGNEGRGHRRDGRVLPVENRHFNHWNTDPWQLDYGGRGDVLGSGTVFLLPYYLGLYHGYIAKP